MDLSKNSLFYAVVCLLSSLSLVNSNSNVNSHLNSNTETNSNYNNRFHTDCNTLKLGQYLCPDPDPEIHHIDPATQQYYGCTKKNVALVQCIAAYNIICDQTGNSTFWKEMPCKWTNGYHLDIALLLSIFFGMFGLDRFYLGYPALGLAKMFSLGFFFIGQLLDIIWIAAQVVGPADGSAYIIPYYGAGVQVIRSDNNTYRLPQDDWNL